MKTLYIDCFAGISGDMTLGAFIDLGVDKDFLISELNKLNLDGYEIKVSKVSKNGIMATDVDVLLSNNDDHHHIHDEAHEHHHDHDHSHDHSHSHEHTHSHCHKTKEHHHRTYKDIKEMILNSSLNDKDKELSLKIFDHIAIAEAKIHGKTIDEVHFHEVGAIDSIVDIVGASICINTLKIDKVISAPITTGSGFVKCDHGIMPVPAPATLEIIKNNNAQMIFGNYQKEMTTPTGAAILCEIVDEFSTNPPQGNPIQIGYGSGKRDMDVANVLRLIVFEDKKKL